MTQGGCGVPADTLSFDLNPFPDIAYTEGLFTDYMYFDAKSISPRYEFGYGLSYSFATVYSGLAISSSSAGHTITVAVHNAGTRAGTEIVQLYIGFPSGAGEPPKLLRGFEAVALTPGQQSTVRFPLVAKDIRCVGGLRLDFFQFSVWTCFNVLTWCFFSLPL